MAAAGRAASLASVIGRGLRRSRRRDIRVSRLSEKWLQSYDSESSKHDAAL
jgi:hypothetical protein